MGNTSERRAWLGLALGLLVFTSSSARADARITDHGRILIAGQVAGWWQAKHDWQVAVEPSVAWFFRDHFAVGGYAAYRQLETPSTFGAGATTYEAGIQSVNELALTDRLGLFGIAKVGFARRDFKSVATAVTSAPITPGGSVFEAMASTQQGRNALHFELFVPLTYLVSANVGVGLGPQFAADWYADEDDHDLRVGAASWIAVAF